MWGVSHFNCQDRCDFHFLPLFACAHNLPLLHSAATSRVGGRRQGYPSWRMIAQPSPALPPPSRSAHANSSPPALTKLAQRQPVHVEHVADWTRGHLWSRVKFLPLWACRQLLGPHVASLNCSWYCSVLITVVPRRALSSQAHRWSVYRQLHFLGRLLHAGHLCLEADGQSHHPLELCAGLTAQTVSGP